MENGAMCAYAIGHTREISQAETNTGGILAVYWNEAVGLKAARDPRARTISEARSWWTNETQRFSLLVRLIEIAMSMAKRRSGSHVR